MPKVSLCIPTYNRQDLLPFAIESVLQQSFGDWELIVCDDGSTDGTPELMSRYSDLRIRYQRHAQNIGKSNNMRSGFALAQGQYFIKFDDDDRLTPAFLERTVAILDQEPAVDFVGTDHWLIDRHHQRQETASDRNSQIWGRTALREGKVADLLTVVFVHQSFQIGATLFRYATLQAVNFMRPNWRNCEDNDLFVRLALAGKVGYYLPERLMEYRVHEGQQGLDRAIPYLEDKIVYLQAFQFNQLSLEHVRRSRLQESQLLLGLRYVEAGKIQEGRQYLQRIMTDPELPLAAFSPTPSTAKLKTKFKAKLKAQVGLGLSYLPEKLRRFGFTLSRKFSG